MSFQRTSVRDADGSFVEADIVPVTAKQDNQSTYLLADGTTLTVQPVVVQVARVPDAYDSDGNPKYIVKTQLVVNAISPKELRENKGAE